MTNIVADSRCILPLRDLRIGRTDKRDSGSKVPPMMLLYMRPTTAKIRAIQTITVALRVNPISLLAALSCIEKERVRLRAHFAIGWKLCGDLLNLSICISLNVYPSSGSLE